MKKSDRNKTIIIDKDLEIFSSSVYKSKKTEKIDFSSNIINKTINISEKTS